MKQVKIINTLFIVSVFLCHCVTKKDHGTEPGIIVSYMDSYVIDLQKETYTVFFMNDKPYIARFHLDSNEKEKIWKHYQSLELSVYDSVSEVQDFCSDQSPKFFTKFSFTTSTTLKRIKLDISCDSFNNSQTRQANLLKEFSKMVKSIVYIKKEVIDAPKSDMLYY